MNFSQFFLILKARSWIALLALGVTVATTLIVSLLLPKSYTATTTLIVDAKSKDPITGQFLPAQLIPGYIATQVDIIQSQNVALKVVGGLKLADNPNVREQFLSSTDGKSDVNYWLADLLLKNLEVQPSRESSAIQLSFSGSDPNFAALIANAFAKSYIQTNLELQVEPARQLNTWYDSKIAELRTAVEQAQSKLSSYQREKGLFADDERIDVETARLNELSTQLVVAQSQTFDSRSRQTQSSDALPDIMNSPVVQGLRADVARTESKLAELAEKIGKNHPHYQSADAELKSLRSKLNIEIATATRSVSSSAKVAQQREGELRGALSAQKSRILDLKQKRDQLAVLTRDVENAQRMYDLALQRQNQSSLESQSNQTDIAILNPAVPPVEPSSPNILLNTILSVFLGSLLAVGLVFLMEMLDRRVRSAEDLSVGLDLPVLGELSMKQSSRGGLFRRKFA